MHRQSQPACLRFSSLTIISRSVGLIFMSPIINTDYHTEFRFKIVLQALVNPRCGELQRMIRLSPAEIAVNDGDITRAVRISMIMRRCTPLRHHPGNRVRRKWACFVSSDAVMGPFVHDRKRYSPASRPLRSGNISSWTSLPLW